MRTFDGLVAKFADQGMALRVVHKSVKHINFRIKHGQCIVSAPVWVSKAQLVDAIGERLAWASKAHQQLIARQTNQTPTLWGQAFEPMRWLEAQQFSKRTHQKLTSLPQEELLKFIYKQELTHILPTLQEIWQPQVGKQASQLSVRHMTSRWGSCQTKSAKITLSSRLAAYPRGCADYVLVHELCHLHHANHSARFWQCVKKVMPDYQHWHDLLKKPPTV